MPRKSLRIPLLTGLKHLISLQLQTLFQTDDEEDYFDALSAVTVTVLLYLHFQTRRYLVPRTQIPRAPYYATLENWFQQLQKRSRTFRLAMRMTFPSFVALVDLIKKAPVFHPTVKRRPQAPVHLQLAVFLYRMGMAGAGSSLAHTAISMGFEISEGAVHIYTRHIIKAIYTLKDQWIQWPNATTRQRHKRHVSRASKGLFSNCVGFIDGTFINLLYTPEVDHFFYYNRKSTYAINAMVICNAFRQIIYIRAGDTSAVHDSTVFARSLICQNINDFFDADEYLLADSAYTPTHHMIPPFKKPRARQSDCKAFNFALSQQRIVIEHTFGMIKARFPALTNVPVRITDVDSHEVIVQWFEVGCILHNFLLARQDEKDWIESETEWKTILRGLEAERVAETDSGSNYQSVDDDNLFETEGNKENEERREILLGKFILSRSST